MSEGITLIEAIENFDFIRQQYRSYGTLDSEVTEIFEECINFVIDGDEYDIPDTDEEWGIYHNQFNNSIAKLLACSLSIIVTLIQASDEDQDYIRSLFD